MGDILNLGFGHTGIYNEFVIDPPPTTVAYIADLSGRERTRTTDATPIVAFQFWPLTVISAIAKPSMGDLVIHVLAHKLDGSIAGSWHRGRTAKWDNTGAITLVGSTYDMRPENGSSGCVVDITTSTTALGVQLTGLAATTIDWVVKWEWLTLNDVTA